MAGQGETIPTSSNTWTPESGVEEGTGSAVLCCAVLFAVPAVPAVRTTTSTWYTAKLVAHKFQVACPEKQGCITSYSNKKGLETKPNCEQNPPFWGTKSTALHYTTLHSTTRTLLILIHYVHYTIPLVSKNRVRNQTKLRAEPALLGDQSTALHYTTPHYTTLHYTTIHYRLVQKNRSSVLELELIWPQNGSTVLKGL